MCPQACQRITRLSPPPLHLHYTHTHINTHINTQDIKAAQRSARLPRLGGTLVAMLDRPLARAPQPPAGIASGNHGASVCM